MVSKDIEKKFAIKLRKKGYSYSEILNLVNISKTTLSSCLRHINLSNLQIERLRLKNAKARQLGSVALRNNRIRKTKQITDASKLEISSIDLEKLKIIGAVLYWAEGSKQNDNRPSKELIFTNSDPKMIRLYLVWLNKCLLVETKDLRFEIYIHETYDKTSEELLHYWSNSISLSLDSSTKIYFKKNKVNSMRRNKGEGYYGVLRVSVRNSVDMSRKVMGWVEGICLQCRTVR